MVMISKQPMAFVKLYGQELFTSSLWEESTEVRILFIWFLARADENGVVQYHSPESLARQANMTPQAVTNALEAPDSRSHSSEHDGRRLVPCQVEGQRDGWLVVNARKYREAQTIGQAKHAGRQAQYRARKGKSAKRKEVERFDETAGNVAPDFVYDELDRDA
jgi:hypothetical protein